MERPTRLLCKRTFTLGAKFYWDESSPSVRHEVDNNFLIKGNWYEVAHNDNDVWTENKKTISVINEKGSISLYFIYSDEDKKNFPSHCDLYGPRDYEKWFYTPEEVRQIEENTYTESYKVTNDIDVFPGNYHWVKSEGEWIIALATSKHEIHGKHYWKTFGHTGADKSDFDFEEIGDRVESLESQRDNQASIERYKELNEEIFPLIDCINKKDTFKEYPSVEYIMPFVNKAIREYFDKSFNSLSSLFLEKT